MITKHTFSCVMVTYVQFLCLFPIGIADIRSPFPVNRSMTQHFLHIGRRYRQGFLQLDNQDRVSGMSPGWLTGLDIFTDVYVGGLDLELDRHLPEGVNFSTGFTGKI